VYSPDSSKLLKSSLQSLVKKLMKYLHSCFLVTEVKLFTKQHRKEM